MKLVNAVPQVDVGLLGTVDRTFKFEPTNLFTDFDGIKPISVAIENALVNENPFEKIDDLFRAVRLEEVETVVFPVGQVTLKTPMQDLRWQDNCHGYTIDSAFVAEETFYDMTVVNLLPEPGENSPQISSQNMAINRNIMCADLSAVKWDDVDIDSRFIRPAK